jgi:nitrate reductase assembly molybdenum cofactor insertion protein NarJ
VSAPLLDPAQRRLLEQAAEWRLLGLLLECPSEEWRRQVGALAAELRAEGLREAAQAALGQAGQGFYHALLGPGGAAPGREAAAQPASDPGRLMAELTAVYEAFGYRPGSPEPPDHVSVEAGFLGYLRLKQAYALACGQADWAERAAQAARRFLAEHLSGLAEALARTLPDWAPAYLASACRELRARAQAEAGA